MTFPPAKEKPWREPNAPDCRCGHPASKHGAISGGCYGPAPAPGGCCPCSEYELPVISAISEKDPPCPA